MQKNGVIRLRKYRYVLIVLMAILLALMFHVSPYDNMDFVRHSRVMDFIRDSHISLKNFLLNADSINKNETSSDTFGFNILEYFFSTTFKNNYVFVWFLTAVNYSAIAYIAYDYKKGYKIEEVLFAIGLCFGYLPFVHVVSGLRTGNAICLVTLSIYLLYFKKRYLISIFLSIIAIMIHSIVIIPIFVAVVVYLIPNKKIIFVFGGAFLFLNVVIKILSNFSLGFITRIITKYNRYTGENQFKGYKFSFYGALVFCLIYLFFYMCFYYFKDNSKKYNNNFKFLRLNKYNKEIKEKFFLFLASYSVVIICNYNGHEFVNRLSYLIGAFSPIITSYFYEPKKELEEQAVAFVTRMALLLLIFAMCALNIFHYKRFFL